MLVLRPLIIALLHRSARAQGMEELLTNTRTVLEGGKPTNNVFSHSLAFNLIPFIDKLQPNGYSREEIKVALETRKIFGLEEGDVRISCTAVRVPITRVHSEAITIETHSPIDPERARKVLRSATGVELIDDPADNIYPMPISATGKQAVEVKHHQNERFMLVIAKRGPIHRSILLCCCSTGRTSAAVVGLRAIRIGSVRQRGPAASRRGAERGSDRGIPAGCKEALAPV